MVQSRQSSTCWRRYRWNSRGKPLEDGELYQRIYKIYHGIGHSEPNQLLAAALTVAWLWGLRVSELTDFLYEREFKELQKPYDKISIAVPGILVKNFWSEEGPDRNELLYANIYRRRKGKPKTVSTLRKYKDPATVHKIIRSHLVPEEPKNIPVMISFNGEETPDTKYALLLKHYLYSYLPEKLGFNLENPMDVEKFKTTKLFPVDRAYLINHLNRCDGELNWHFLRKLRATYLVRYFNFSANDLLSFFGWKTFQQPILYTMSGNWSIKSRFIEKFKEQQNDLKLEKQFDKQYIEVFND